MTIEKTLEIEVAKLLMENQFSHATSKYDPDGDGRHRISDFIYELNEIISEREFRFIFSREDFKSHLSISGKYINKHHPDTFEIPKEKDVEKIHEKFEKTRHLISEKKPKISVKIIIVPENGYSERFWVSLTEFNIYEKYAEGIIDNDLICNDLKLGDNIIFHTDSIIDIM